VLKYRRLTSRQFLSRLKQLGLSQAAFAKAIGKSRRTVQRWANNDVPVPYDIGLLLETFKKKT